MKHEVDNALNWLCTESIGCHLLFNKLRHIMSFVVYIVENKQTQPIYLKQNHLRIIEFQIKHLI